MFILAYAPLIFLLFVVTFYTIVSKKYFLKQSTTKCKLKLYSTGAFGEVVFGYTAGTREILLASGITCKNKMKK